jgi:hypothetical protein
MSKFEVTIAEPIKANATLKSDIPNIEADARAFIAKLERINK